MQTLSSVAQTNILCFLEVEHTFFRQKDLETLALDLLATSSDVNFWVKSAAQNLLNTVGCSHKVNQGELVSQYKTPSWLLNHNHGPPLLPWMPVIQPSQRNTAKLFLQENVNPGLSGDCGKLQEVDPSTFDPLKNETSCFPNERVQDEKASAVILQGSLVHFPGYIRSPKKVHSPVVGLSVEDDNVFALNSKPETRAQLEPSQSEEKVALASALADSLKEAWVERQPRLDDLNKLSSLSDLSLFLKALKPWDMKDDAMFNLTKVLLLKDSSLEWSGLMASYCLLPKLLLLEQPASRFLLSAVIEACNTNPQAMIDALLVPLVLSEKGPSKVQCDILNRVLKDCLLDSHVFSFCGKIFVSNRRQFLTFSDSPFLRCSFCTASVVCSEPVWTVLQNALSRPIELDIEALEALVKVCEEEVANYAKSLKFCNLLLCLLSKYGSRLKPFKSNLLNISEQTHTFITKTLTIKSANL